MLSTYHPYTQTLDLQKAGLGTVGCKRTLDLLDCVTLAAAKKARTTVKRVEQLLSETLVDVSQSHDRRPLPKLEGPNRCLTTSSSLFWFQQRRLLCPVEHMLLQGYTLPLQVPQTVSNHQLTSIAGEGIALPNLATIVWALKLTANFP